MIGCRPRTGLPLRRLLVGLWGLLGLAAGVCSAQELPALPSPAPTTPPPPSTPREAELEERVRQLEALVRDLAGRIERVETPPAGAAGTGDAGGAAGTSDAGGAAGGPGDAVGGTAGADEAEEPEPFGTVGSAEAPPAEEQSKIQMPAPPRSVALKAKFGNGFELVSEDEEFQFQFHDLTQIDYRGYWPTPVQPLNNLYHSTFGLPRQWWIFNGRVGKPFEYFVVPAFGFDSINLLDAFLNVHFDDRFQLKIGRYKTPYTYEFYNLPINGLINPERSLFFNNFALNRDVGMMLWGQLFQKRLDYAAGVFNGTRNFFIDRNSSPDIVSYINFRPFANDDDSPLQFFNVGGSVLAGNEMNAPIPQILRTNVATTGASFFGVPFLAFNNNVIESGPRVLWDLHAAWYYKQLSLIGEWASGFQDYATIQQPFNRTHLPVSGWYVQLGYFLTGETVAARGMARPFRNFDLRKGKFGLGAIELAARYSTVSVGSQVFTNGLADPNLWTNDAQLLDLGFNWYWNQYVKVYLGWQHSFFGSRVIIDPGQFQTDNDMLWARFQIYF